MAFKLNGLIERLTRMRVEATAIQAGTESRMLNVAARHLGKIEIGLGIGIGLGIDLETGTGGD